MKHIALSACLLLGTALSGCDSQLATTETTIDTDSDFFVEAQALLDASFPDDGPGAVAIVTKGNKTIYVGGQGVASIDNPTDLNAHSVFRYASITKQFTAATIMLLVEDGLVELDAPLSEYLPDYPEPGASATVRQLLNHTSGIKSYTSIPGMMVPANTEKAYTTEALIASFETAPMDFQPGEHMAYNNSGYVLLGAIIESVTGKPWFDAVEARIAKPLSLETLDTGVNESDIQSIARGYSGGDTVQSAQTIHMSIPHGAGAIVGDVQDLADWANAFHDGEVVNTESYAAMISPTKTGDGKIEDYGFGLSLGSFRDRDVIGHNGGIFGFSTDSVYIPDEDVFVAVLANSDQPQTPPNVVMRKLAGMAIGEPFKNLTEVAVDYTTLDAEFGVYKSDSVTRTFFIRDGEIYTYREGGSEARVLSAGDSQYFYGPDSLSWFEIKTDGETPQMFFHSGSSNKPDILNWTAPPPVGVDVATDILESYLGNYKLEVPLDAVIAPAEGGINAGITIQLTGQQPFPLNPESETEFSVRAVGATIIFEAGDDNAMSMKILQGGQTINGQRVGD